jgi:hypothetical protein
MATITVPLNKVATVFRKYGTAARHETAQGLPVVVKRAEIIITSATRRAPPASPNGSTGAVNYGKYLKAWSAKVTKLNGNRGVLVGNNRKYAPNIDYGRRAGAKAPPVSAIALWAVKKMGLPYKAALKIAGPIATSIAKRGLKPRGVLRGPNTTKDFLDAMESAMSAALSKAAQRVAIP